MEATYTLFSRNVETLGYKFKSFIVDRRRVQKLFLSFMSISERLEKNLCYVVINELIIFEQRHYNFIRKINGTC